jgi:hypothetical protein
VIGWEAAINDLLSYGFVNIHIQPELDKPPRATKVVKGLVNGVRNMP